jgi:hypothetical protein
MENGSSFVGRCDSVFVICPATGRGGQLGVNLFGQALYNVINSHKWAFRI